MNNTERVQHPRHAESLLLTALSDTRIVALVGPRQSGKTTLARKLARQRQMRFITLDDEQSRQFANDDPTGFLRNMDSAVIDEIQRAPDLILGIKRLVDEDTTPGRFLITGSVDLFKGMLAPDSLAGRVETISLLPLSQSELANQAPSAFIDRAFTRNFSDLTKIGYTHNLVNRVLTGGFPEASARPLATRRRAWFNAYASSISERDVADIANVEKSAEFSRLIEFSALAAGQLVNLSSLSSHVHADSKTVDRWLQLLEQLFMLTRLRAWHSNKLKRLAKSPKMHFIDSGLLAAIQNTSEADIERDRTKFGSLLECFVYSEILKSSALSEQTISLSHFRENENLEVDLVLERGPANLVGIEIKASATVKPRDFKGLKRLQSVTGNSFQCGLVLHDGDRMQQVDEKLFILPISALWE